MTHHHHRIPAIVAAIIILFTASAARAQETQVPIDSAGKINRIDLELESRLGLFPEYRDFQEARLYQLSDSLFALEIYYGADGKSQRQRRNMTAAQTAELRATVTHAIAERAPTAGLNQEGRARLLTGTTIMGLGYYGFMVPVAFNAQSGESAVAFYMLSGAASFFVPYFATSKANVTYAQANLGIYGGIAGALHGYLIYTLLGGSDYDYSGAATATVIGGLAESVFGYAIAGTSKLSEGKADVIALGGTAGLGLGAGIALLANIDKTSQISEMMLLGSGAGFAAGNAIANMQHYTAGDADVLSTSCVLGTYTIPALLYLGGLDFNASDGKVPTIAAIAGGVGGLVLGHYLVKDHEFSSPHGQYIALGTMAGAALGLGVAYLASPNGEDGKLYTALPLLGGAGTFALMYSLLQKENRARSESSNIRFDVSPAGIAAFALGRTPAAGSRVSVPIAGMQYRF